MISVLIVEDHQIVIDGLQTGLNKEPDLKVVAVASTMSDGLKLVAEHSPDVLLLDLHLPDGIGPKTLVRNFRNTHKGKIIVFSAELRMPVVQMVMDLGVAAYLLKSESIDKISETIRLVMNGAGPIVSRDVMSDDPQLSKAEEHLVRMLSHGMKYQDIADKRQTAAATVRKQVELLLLKLDLTSREELIAWAVDNGYNKLGIEEAE